MRYLSLLYTVFASCPISLPLWQRSRLQLRCQSFIFATMTTAERTHRQPKRVRAENASRYTKTPIITLVIGSKVLRITAFCGPIYLTPVWYPSTPIREVALANTSAVPQASGVSCSVNRCVDTAITKIIAAATAFI